MNWLFSNKYVNKHRSGGAQLEQILSCYGWLIQWYILQKKNIFGNLVRQYKNTSIL